MLKNYILELEVGMSFNMLNILANDVEVVVTSNLIGSVLTGLL